MRGWTRCSARPLASPTASIGPRSTRSVLLAAAERDVLLERMRTYPPVRVARYHDGPRVCRTAEEALRIAALWAEARRPMG